MAQHDYVISNDSGANVRADLNNVLQAILTNNSGSTAPSATASGNFWFDTSDANTYYLKMRNHTNDGWTFLGEYLVSTKYFKPMVNDDTLDAYLSSKVDKVSSTDNAIVRFNGTTGEVQNSGVFIDDSNNVGIGTSSPEALLDLEASVKPVLRLTGSGNNASDTEYGAVEFFNKDSSGSGAEVASSIRVKSASPTGAAGEMVFSTSDAVAGEVERVRISSTGNVGIGTSSPQLPLDVVGQIRAKDNTVDLRLSPLDASNVGIVGTYSNDALVFYTNGSERMRILATGGITFNGDTSSANALDDYEEGTWTPRLNDNTTGTGNNGSYATVSNATYTKIGNIVHLNAEILGISTSGMTSGSNMYIVDLPFAVGVDWIGNCRAKNGITSSDNYLCSRTTGNSLVIVENDISGGSSSPYMDVSQFASGTAELHISITYTI